MLKNYFEKITLFTVMAGLSLVAFIIAAISHEADVIKESLLYHLGLAVILFAGIDVLLKYLLKGKTVWLWTIEFFLLLVAIYIWIISE